MGFFNQGAEPKLRGRSGPLHLYVMLFDSQDIHPVKVVPRGQLAFLGQTDLAEGGGGGLELQQIEHDPLQARQVFSRVILAHRGGILAEVHVEHPMNAIFDSPVRSDRLREVRGRQGTEQTGRCAGQAN